MVQGPKDSDTHTAVRPACCFGTNPHAWLNLQNACELRCAETKGVRQIEKRVKPLRRAA